MAKKNRFSLILAITGGVLAVGALIYIFGFTSVGDMFFRGKAERALSAGRVEIMSEKDIEDYFVFLPAEEVKALLNESDGKFLFPQMDFLLASGKSLVVESKETNIGDFPLRFLTVSGLSSGAKIYSTGGGFVRGGTVPNEGDSYAWMKEIRDEGGNGEVMLTYFPIPETEALVDLVFAMEMDEEMYSPAELGVQIASLFEDDVLPESVVPGGVNIAVAIAGEDGSYIKLGLEDILIKDGKIVMVQK
jgi:hypothetical protein